MARDESPPFPRGEYDADAGAFDNLIGREYQFEDIDLSPGTVGARPTRTNRLVRCRLVKNVTGSAVLPKLLVKFKTGAGSLYGAEVDGYPAASADRGYPVDEWLPAAGVPDQAYFYIVVDGPAVINTLAAGPGTTITEGDIMIASGAGSGDVGTVVELGTLSTDDSAAKAAINYVGRAIQAVATNYTGLGILVEVGRW